jgi:hypothetical protein
MATFKHQKQLHRALVVGFSLTVGVMRAGLACADNVTIADNNQKIVTVDNVAVHNGVVSGEILNHSNREVRDVELLIRHTWQWSNEFHPGNNDPGMASSHILNKSIRPGESMPFSFSESSTLPARSDGQFKSMVSVTGFTEIVRNR